MLHADTQVLFFGKILKRKLLFAWRGKTVAVVPPPRKSIQEASNCATIQSPHGNHLELAPSPEKSQGDFFSLEVYLQTILSNRQLVGPRWEIIPTIWMSCCQVKGSDSRPLVSRKLFAETGQKEFSSGIISYASEDPMVSGMPSGECIHQLAKGFFTGFHGNCFLVPTAKTNFEIRLDESKSTFSPRFGEGLISDFVKLVEGFVRISLSVKIHVGPFWGQFGHLYRIWVTS